MNPKVSGDSPKVARNSQSLTFGEARRVFIEELERAVALGSRSQNTLWTYGKRLEFFERETGVELLADVTPQLVERFLIDLQQGRLPDSRKKCSSHYAENHWRHLVGFLGWCRRRGYPVSELLFVVGRNGYRSKFSLSPPVLDEPETKTWAQSDVERILEAARSFPPRDQVAVLLLLKSGVRLQELANLELEDVQGPNLRIRRSKSIRDRKLRVTRWAPLYPDVRKLVEVYIQRYRPASEEPYLLLKEDGSRLTRAGLDSMLDRIHLLAGVRGGAHRYRHTFGTEFLRKNPGQIEKLREIMGHESFKTLRRYARLRPEDLADPSEDPFARASLSG